MFDGTIHSAEECTTVLNKAVKVHLLKKVTASFTEVVCVEPLKRNEANLNDFLYKCQTKDKLV